MINRILRGTRFLSLISGMLLFSLCNCSQSQSGAENISTAEKAYRLNCQACHSLPKPDLKTDSEWPDLVKRYGEKANLDSLQIKQIISYLTANN